eukprot:3568617-Rhodomonas_salina.6
MLGAVFHCPVSVGDDPTRLEADAGPVSNEAVPPKIDAEGPSSEIIWPTSPNEVSPSPEIVSVESGPNAMLGRRLMEMVLKAPRVRDDSWTAATRKRMRSVAARSDPDPVTGIVAR